MSVFIFDGILINIKKINNESEYIYYKRVNKIIKNYKSSNYSIEELIKLSILWSNIKFKKCKYKNEIMNKVDELVY